MKRKIAAIMAADVFGYSRLIAEDEEGTLRRLIAYREVFADFVGRAGGRIFNTAGDAVLAEFPSAVDGLRAAIEIQESVRTRNLAYPESQQMRFRIGMTIGDVVERDGDLLGDGVNVAARLEGLAEPGGICVSRSVHEQVSSKMAVAFRDIGLQSVKNIPSPIHAYQVPSAGADKPPEGQAKPTGRPRHLAVALVCIVTVAGAVAATVLTHAVWSPAPVPDSKPPEAPAAIVAAAPTPVAVPPPVAAPLPVPVSPAQSGTTTSAGQPSPPAPTPAPPAPSAAAPVPPPDARAAADPTTSGVRPLDASTIPFVTDEARVEIARTLRQARNTAVAIGKDGTSGYVARRTTADRAGRDAIDSCAKAGGVDCLLYAVNDEIVWPRLPPKMPPEPWIDDAVPATPFKGDRIPGLEGAARKDAGDGYRNSKGHKALAVGPDQTWRYFYERPTAREAQRLALEACADDAGAACRLVAVDGVFVVPLDQGSGDRPDVVPHRP